LSCGQGQRLTVLVQTTMPLSLPPEILDLIVDHLHDEPTALKTCCVVSKSWIQRTRTHLFASVEFSPPTFHIELWKKTFPDPSNSPAHHTRSLTIRGIPVVTAADTDEGGWICTFHNLVHLYLESHNRGKGGSLTPFHGISPALRSLHLICTSPDALDLICSFPLLEDLAMFNFIQGGDVWNTPPTSPKLTGSLGLSKFGRIQPVARRLLSLPNGLHFTKITVALDQGIQSVVDLVSRCSYTLESINIYYSTPGMSSSAFAAGQCLTACGSRHI
jgi:hypothetical protein